MPPISCSNIIQLLTINPMAHIASNSCHNHWLPNGAHMDLAAAQMKEAGDARLQASDEQKLQRADEEFQNARAKMAEAQEQMEQTEFLFWHAELCRTEGEVRRQAGASDIQVEACFVRAIERARQMSDPEATDVKMDPQFDTLHGDPRFAKLLAAIGMAQ